MAKSSGNPSETPVKKVSKLTGHEQVIEYLNTTDHPLKAVMEAAREIVLNANQGITEHIKWNAPSFCFNGADRVTFNLYKKEYVLVVFHTGGIHKEREGNSPLVEDRTGLLEWVTNDRATVKLYSLEDLNAKKALLREVVKQWING